jgi:5'/3'-nucleotidase SurE
MAIKRILLTGDDGYNSKGTRILVAMLKDKYDLQIIGTKDQHSGIGGKITTDKKVMKWGENVVDGVKAVWVDGTPVDAMEFATGYVNQPFDLLISGINWGQNIGLTPYTTSGTFTAAVRGLGVKLAPKAIVFGLEVDADDWFKKHESDESIEYLLEYPGEQILKMVNLCVSNNFFNTNLVNITFPAKETTKYQITQLSKDLTKQYFYPPEIDYKKHTWSWPSEMYSKQRDTDKSLDTYAFDHGIICTRTNGKELCGNRYRNS